MRFVKDLCQCMNLMHSLDCLQGSTLGERKRIIAKMCFKRIIQIRLIAFVACVLKGREFALKYNS